MAALLGVDVDRTISLTFVMGAALAAVAGLMFMIYYGVVSFNDGFVPGVKAFTAAVLGGIGSLPGAVLGGLLIGLIETLWSAYFSIDYKDVATFCILAVTLIFLPSGLLGHPTWRRCERRWPWSPPSPRPPNAAARCASLKEALGAASGCCPAALGLAVPILALRTEQLVLAARWGLLRPSSVSCWRVARRLL